MDTIGPKRINKNKGKPLKVIQDDKGCFVCTSHAPNADGYFRLFVSKESKPRMKFLHRIEWEKVNGPVPEGYELDHICRNRGCCNTAHLQLLSTQEHKVKTNRERYAERTDVIKSAILKGERLMSIAAQHGVTYATVSRIKRNMKEK